MGYLTNLNFHYTLDETSGTRLDSTAGANDLTLTGSNGSGTGKIGNAFQANGSNSLGHAAASAFSMAGDSTVAVWVNLGSTGALSYIVDKWPASGASDDYLLFFDDGSILGGGARFAFAVRDVASGAFNSVSANTFGAPTAGVWYLLIAKHDNTGGHISISVNAGTPDSVTHSTGVRYTSSGSDFRVGLAQSGTLVDMVSGWGRLTTADEDTGLYQGGNGLAYPFNVVVKTRTIAATSSPTTPDYSTLQSWEDDAPAGLVANHQIWDGACLDQGTFTSALTISGQTTDATRYVQLRCATGASFRDKAGVRTTALYYNSANGVTVQAVTNNEAVRVSSDYTRITGLQIKRIGDYGSASLRVTANNCTADSCIVFSPSTPTTTAPVVDAAGTANKFVNCLLIQLNAGVRAVAHTPSLYGCTLINLGGSGNAVESEYNLTLLENCAIFGWSGIASNALAAGSSYNATDLSAISGSTNNQTSLTYADQFVSTTNDFRTKSGHGLQHGTPDTTYLTTDISLFTRDATTPTIGAWENASSPPPPPSASIVASIYWLAIIPPITVITGLLTHAGSPVGPDTVNLYSDPVGDFTLTFVDGTGTLDAAGRWTFATPPAPGNYRLNPNTLGLGYSSLIFISGAGDYGTVTI